MSESGLSVARRLGFELYVPWMLAQIGRGMLLPIVPLYLLEVGLSYTVIALVVSAAGMGSLVGGFPLGHVAGQYGPDLLYIGATLAAAFTAVFLGLTSTSLVLFAVNLVFGVGAFGLRLSALMLITSGTATASRGRGMSIMGGATRIGSFIGPIVGGVIADVAGFEVAFIACGLTTLAGLIPFLLVRNRRPEGTRMGRPAVRSVNLREALSKHAVLLLLAGIGPALILTVRAGRNVVVPLIGDDLGLGASAVGALVAIGTGADLLLFPVAGWLMDRFGRLWAIVPAFSLLGIGMFVLGLSSTTAGAVAAGVVMGVGNGMSAGTMATLGADLAPIDSGPFLSAMSMMQDIGFVAGPIVVGWLADSAGLTQSAIVLGFVMFAGIAWIAIVVGDTAHPSRPWLVARLDHVHDTVGPAQPPNLGS